jgi:hypothetical protein
MTDLAGPSAARVPDSPIIGEHEMRHRQPHRYLRDRPQVFLAEPHEVQFFNRRKVGQSTDVV